MCPLCPRDRSIWRGLSWGRGVSYTDVNALVRKELDQLPPMETPLPVSKDAPHEESMEEKGPLVQVGTPLRSMNLKRQANALH
jgi:hypothetical protein